MKLTIIEKILRMFFYVTTGLSIWGTIIGIADETVDIYTFWMIFALSIGSYLLYKYTK